VHVREKGKIKAERERERVHEYNHSLSLLPLFAGEKKVETRPLAHSHTARFIIKHAQYSMKE
jgi:hypothetical protein